jgi:hypothetical protein
MTNRKDARKRQGASQNLPNTHFQDDSLTDHDVLKMRLNISKTSSDVFNKRIDICVMNCTHFKLDVNPRLMLPVEEVLRTASGPFPMGLTQLRKGRPVDCRAHSRRSRKEAGWGVSGVPDIMFFFFLNVPMLFF